MLKRVLWLLVFLVCRKVFAQNLPIYTKHQDSITHISGEGNYWVTADANNRLILWDLAKNQSVVDWFMPEIRQVEFSPFRKKCAILTPKNLCIIDFQKNTAQKILLNNLPIEKITWAQSGDSLVTLLGQEVVTLALDSALTRSKTNIQFLNRITNYQLSDTFISMTTVNWDEEELIQLYSIHQDEPIFEKKLSEQKYSFWFQKGSKLHLIIAKSDNSIQITDIQSNKEYLPFTYHLKPVKSVSIVGDTVISSDISGMVAFWNLQTGRLIAKLQLPAEESPFLAGIPNRHTVLLQQGAVLNEYSLQGELLQSFGKNTCSKNVAAWLSDSTIIIGTDTLLSSFSLNTLRTTYLETKIPAQLDYLVYNPVKQQIAFSATEGTKTTLRVLAYPGLNTLWSYPLESSVWEQLYFSLDGNRLIGKTKFMPGKTTIAIVWDSNNGTVITQTQSPSYAKQEMAYTRNNQELWQATNALKPVLSKLNFTGNITDSITDYYHERFWVSENGNYILYSTKPNNWAIRDIESKIVIDTVKLSGKLTASNIWQDNWWSTELLDTFPAITKVRCRNIKQQQWIWEEIITGKISSISRSPEGNWITLLTQTGPVHLLNAHTGIPKFELLLTPRGSLAIAQDKNYYCWGTHQPFIQNFTQNFSPSEIIKNIKPESNPFFVNSIHKLEEQRSNAPLTRIDSLPRNQQQSLFLLVIAPEKTADTNLTRYSGETDAALLEKHFKLTKAFASVNVTILKGKNVSHNGLLNTANWLSKAKETDLVWIYVIGNGVITNNGEPGIALNTFKINEPDKQDIITIEIWKELFSKCSAKFRWIMGDLSLSSMLTMSLQPSLKVGAFAGGYLKYRIRSNKTTVQLPLAEATRLFELYGEIINVQTQASVLWWFSPVELLWNKGSEVFSPFTRFLTQYFTPGTCRTIQSQGLTQVRNSFKQSFSQIIADPEIMIPLILPR
ncbi:MAG: hypothetical protein LC115_13925 [Bacteroidia bacterium]|nr:hypothetical protein [Bacteroidia bacterium]